MKNIILVQIAHIIYYAPSIWNIDFSCRFLIQCFCKRHHLHLDFPLQSAKFPHNYWSVLCPRHQFQPCNKVLAPSRLLSAARQHEKMHVYVCGGGGGGGFSTERCPPLSVPCYIISLPCLTNFACTSLRV